MAAATGGGGAAVGPGGSAPASSLIAAPDVEEAADNLRAEVASARILVQQLKQQDRNGGQALRN